MSLNTVPTNYHEYEYSKFSVVFKLKFMTTGRIHASARWVVVWALVTLRASQGGSGDSEPPRGARLFYGVRVACLAL